MKRLLLLIVTTVFIASPVLAEKPEKSGKSKSTMEANTLQKSERIKDHREDAEDGLKDMRQSADMEKHRETKTEAAMKELDKGSEKGQEAREEHRKKWWKFWE